MDTDLRHRKVNVSDCFKDSSSCAFQMKQPELDTMQTELLEFRHRITAINEPFTELPFFTALMNDLSMLPKLFMVAVTELILEGFEFRSSCSVPLPLAHIIGL